MTKYSRVVPIVLVLLTGTAFAQPRFAGPWDLDSLKQVPKAEWRASEAAESDVALKEVEYAGEPYLGRPTRVFAYYARPKEFEGTLPAMVLVHGGGGTAFPEWATLWAKRGYAALAMDTAGQGPGRKRLTDGGPNQSHTEKFAHIADHSLEDMWTFHAVAAVIRGHSLLASLPEVDAERTGITGISWGGYLTCIVTGLDDRLKVSVPVYGCGFLHDNSCWLGEFARLRPDQRKTWIDNFDPSRYLPGVTCPILFVNGTNDFAYPLDSYQKSYQAVPGRTDLCVRVGMPHGHRQGWAPTEIGLFVDSVLRGGALLPRLGIPEIRGGSVTASLQSEKPVVKGQLHYTTDSGPWKPRRWTTAAALIKNGAIHAELPSVRPLAFFLTATDERGATVSTEHRVLSGE